jgi:hypothetical protein
MFKQVPAKSKAPQKAIKEMGKNIGFVWQNLLEGVFLFFWL